MGYNGPDAQSGGGAPSIALGPVPEKMARPAQTRVFIFNAFDRAWFTPPGPIGHQIVGEGFEKLSPQLGAFLFGACLAHCLGERTQRIQRAFEADPFQWNGVFDRRLGHGAE